MTTSYGTFVYGSAPPSQPYPHGESGTLLPGVRKFCKISQKWPQKISFGRGIFVAVRPPILAKCGRNEAVKTFSIYYLLFLQGQSGPTVNLFGL